ncbi:adhesion G protein-coupled receptor L4-like [Stylophora pistillata]|uniref:adhesion G protein-coupled receptor L4-like n=1 Tax=Stylophora pistillata TaxID=50429 RepID=UPI000C056F85|nr:adhesion G protein-coupled receptor L4-like [Stylophora pistillata]
MTLKSEHSMQQTNVVDLLQDTLARYKEISFTEVQHKIITEQKRKKLIYATANAFQTFALRYGRHHLNESKPWIRKSYDKIRVLRIRKIRPLDLDDFRLGESIGETVNIPSVNFKEKGLVIVGIVYRDLHELLGERESNGTTSKKRRRLDSLIMAAAMDPKPKRLKRNVVLKFRNRRFRDATRRCVYWRGFDSISSDGWSDEGCRVSKRNSYDTECSCNHLTHFAVLFDFGNTSAKPTKTDEEILTILTYVGLTLSLIGIILTIVLYALLTDVHQPLSQVRFSLAASLGLGQIMFLAGINATQDKGICVAVAALMQYFFMSAFFWMLVEGIYLYLFVVKVYNIDERMALYHACSWGLPAVLVSISLIIASAREEIDSFISKE